MHSSFAPLGLPRKGRPLLFNAGEPMRSLRNSRVAQPARLILLRPGWKVLCGQALVSADSFAETACHSGKFEICA